MSADRRHEWVQSNFLLLSLASDSIDFPENIKTEEHNLNKANKMSNSYADDKSCAP